MEEAAHDGANRYGQRVGGFLLVGGVATLTPLDMATSKLLANADLAMYHAKDHGPGQVQVFEPWMLEQLSSRAAMEASLRAGLGTGQFFLQYQPEIDLPTGKLRSVEALLRWRELCPVIISPRCDS